MSRLPAQTSELPQQLVELLPNSHAHNAYEQRSPLLDALLKKNDSSVSVTAGGKYMQKAVTVIIRGDRPEQKIEDSEPRRAGIDGRLSDLDRDKSAELEKLSEFLRSSK